MSVTQHRMKLIQVSTVGSAFLQGKVNSSLITAEATLAGGVTAHPNSAALYIGSRSWNTQQNNCLLVNYEAQFTANSCMLAIRNLCSSLSHPWRGNELYMPVYMYAVGAPNIWLAEPVLQQNVHEPVMVYNGGI